MTFPIRFALSLVAFASAIVTAAAPAGSFTFPGSEGPWFVETADMDGDGLEELIAPTMEGSNSRAITFPTPVRILAVNDGVILDRSDEMFGTPPSIWSVRTVVPGDFNGDGQRDLLLCNEGRKPDASLKTNPRTPGVWGEQSQVWFGQDGRLVNRTAEFPQSIAFCHGASAGNLDANGRDALVLNTVGGVVNDSGAYPPFPPTYVVRWSGAGFTWSNPFPPETGTRFGKPWGFTTATADFNGDGFADVAGAAQVLMGGATPRARSLTASPVEAQYSEWNGTVVGDVNGDGLPDVVRIQSTKALAGARFALYVGNRTDGLVLKADAFPALESYGVNEFGIDASLVDVNFDGAPDIVVKGSTYAIGPSYPAGTPLHTTADAVWLNDGGGRFRLAHFTDTLVATSVCGGTRGSFPAAYFLKTGDPLAFNLVVQVCGPGVQGSTLITRRVTSGQPLTFLP